LDGPSKERDGERLFAVLAFTVVGGRAIAIEGVQRPRAGAGV
jgi:hypothetical protein